MRDRRVSSFLVSFFPPRIELSGSLPGLGDGKELPENIP